MSPAPAGGLDVIIPARDEEAELPACLDSVLAQRGVVAINIAVIANGCSDRTAEVARGYAEAVEAEGHRLTVIEIAEAGKARALNAADPLLQGGVHVFLDADTALSDGALRELHRVLASDRRPRMAAPLPLPLMPDSRIARSYAEVWMRLPSVADQVVGLGCYAVNSAGRGRWPQMPVLVADDAYVRSRFSAGERVLLRTEQMVYAFPSGGALLDVLSRWRGGNRELARLSPGADPRASSRAALRSLGSMPSVWRHLPAFAVVSAAVRLRGRPTSWAKAPRRARGTPLPLRPRLAVRVSPGSGSGRPQECLRSLRLALQGPSVEITVAEDAAAELFLLIGANVIAEPRAIALLLLVARRFPWAGIYGGQERRPGEGERPPMPPRIEPVMTMPGALLMVGAEAWARLMEPETEKPAQADPGPGLCARALRQGFTPLRVSAAGFSFAAGGRY